MARRTIEEIQRDPNPGQNRGGWFKTMVIIVIIIFVIGYLISKMNS